jgi:1-pyrroline-5-carboxylate dehydrogenase
MATRKTRRKTARRAKKPAFKLTYATMFDPPPELHDRFEAALAATKAGMGKEHTMLIGGREVDAPESFEDRSPMIGCWAGSPRAPPSMPARL